MKTYKLVAQKREDLSKSKTQELRKRGIVPGVLYDKEENQPISVFINDLHPVVFTPYTYNIHVEVDGKTYQSVLQDIQFHPVSDEVIHVDLYKITPDKPIKTLLPVICEGNPEGVKQGGRFLQKIRKMSVKGVPDELPDEIRVEVAHLNLGESVKVEDLEEEGIEMLNAPGDPVCTVSIPRSLKAKGIVPPGESQEGAEEGEEGEEETAEEGESQGEGEESNE